MIRWGGRVFWGGVLTLCGWRRPVDCPLSCTRERARVRAEGEASLRRGWFDGEAGFFGLCFLRLCGRRRPVDCPLSCTRERARVRAEGEASFKRDDLSRDPRFDVARIDFLGRVDALRLEKTPHPTPLSKF
jgi:hypothetical protein